MNRLLPRRRASRGPPAASQHPLGKASGGSQASGGLNLDYAHGCPAATPTRILRLASGQLVTWFPVKLSLACSPNSELLSLGLHEADPALGGHRAPPTPHPTPRLPPWTPGPGSRSSKEGTLPLAPGLLPHSRLPPGLLIHLSPSDLNLSSPQEASLGLPRLLAVPRTSMVPLMVPTQHFLFSVEFSLLFLLPPPHPSPTPRLWGRRLCLTTPHPWSLPTAGGGWGAVNVLGIRG